MKKYISTILASLAMVSCVDTVLLPDDKTVDQDFWKTKSDVNQMVQGAYKSMLSTDVMSRLIVWGDFRSDELNLVSSITGSIPTALTEIDAVNMQTTNTFATWGGLYSVINNCNIVLDKSKAVMDVDPSLKVTIQLTAHRCWHCALCAISIWYATSAMFHILVRLI